MNNKERDMFYSNYGYAGMMPPPTIPNQTMMMPNQTMMPNPAMMPNSSMNYNNDLEQRVSKIEKQIKRLEQRISRLENPYQSNQTNIYNEPDSNMYMM